MKNILIYLSFVSLFCLGACTKLPPEVKYEADCGSGDITVHYMDAAGNNKTYIGTAGWEMEFGANSGAQLSISAQADPSVYCTVRIYINGEQKAKDTTYGQEASVNCTVP